MVVWDSLSYIWNILFLSIVNKLKKKNLPGNMKYDKLGFKLAGEQMQIPNAESMFTKY